MRAKPCSVAGLVWAATNADAVARLFSFAERWAVLDVAAGTAAFNEGAGKGADLQQRQQEEQLEAGRAHLSWRWVSGAGTVLKRHTCCTYAA